MQDYFSLTDNIILQIYQMSTCSAHNELKSTQFQVYYTQRMSIASFNPNQFSSL
jgi:hypothetical protein